jgi:hypothetical protein
MLAGRVEEMSTRTGNLDLEFSRVSLELFVLIEKRVDLFCGLNIFFLVNAKSKSDTNRERKGKSNEWVLVKNEI